jgi:L-threonylcarbamoyladenylate synthase
VAFPTETVYGLGAHALDAAAVGRIYAAKGRPATNPVIVHVADAAAARTLAAAWPPAAEALAARFWPGPLTLVLPKAAAVPDAVTAGLPAVALRVPAHPVALALLRAAGLPVAAPSANRSTEVSPTTAAHVVASLGSAVDLVLDGGPTTVGIESTVLDLTGDRPRILRPGMVSAEAIAAVAGPLAAAPTTVDDATPRASPGMMERHYAPRAPLRVVEHGMLAGAVAAGPAPVGLVTYRPPPTLVGAPRIVMLPDEPEGYARRLYAALHELDAAGAAAIVVEAVPETAAWDAIRDRLRRAATP